LGTWEEIADDYLWKILLLGILALKTLVYEFAWGITSADGTFLLVVTGINDD
jgi:hypothetical protein